MDHADFVRAYRSGTVSVRVDKHIALRLVESSTMPRHYKRVYVFWTAAWGLAIPAAVAVLVLAGWWAGLVMLLVALVLPSIIRHTVCEIVLDYALENEGFYRLALESKALVIEGEPDPAPISPPRRRR